MKELVVVLTKKLLAKTNNEDLERKLAEAIKKSYKPDVLVRVSKMTSNKVCLNLNLDGYVQMDDVEIIQDDIVDAVAFYFGDVLEGKTVTTTISCTIFEEMEFEIL